MGSEGYAWRGVLARVCGAVDEEVVNGIYRSNGPVTAGQVGEIPWSDLAVVVERSATGWCGG